MSKDALMCDRVEGGFIPVPSPTPGVGKIQLLPKIADALKELPFLLCGPPRTGKHNLLKLATQNANLGMSTYDLGHISTNFKVRYDDLYKMLNNSGGKLQTNLMGVRSLLVLQGGEHLDTETAQLVRKYDVVILANERTAPLRTAFGDQTVWVNRLTKDELRCSLQILHPQALPIQISSAVQVADGDLRKALRELQFGGHRVDKAGHVYFDVQDALCKGARKNLDSPCRAWLLENHTHVNKSLEEHATFSENLLAAELLAEANTTASEADWGEAESMAEGVTGLATRKLVGHKRVPFSLTNPPDKSCSPIKSALPQKLCLERTQLENYFARNGAAVTETTPSERPSKVTKTSNAGDVHTQLPQPTCSPAASCAPASSQATTQCHQRKVLPPKRPSGPRAASASSSAPPPPTPSPSDTNIILELKGLKVMSTQPFASRNGEEYQKMACGPTYHRQHTKEI